jgi:2-phosphosulfolactate phosphatase
MTIVIDCFPDGIHRYGAGWAVIAVDVIRATTTAVTAVEGGRWCFPVPSLEVAVPLAARLHNPLLVGELGGNMPYGFDLNNSPAAVAARRDVERPMILLSTTGTRLMCEIGAEAVYAACLRNHSAQARQLAGRHAKIAVIGAGTRGEFREEDQLCCAWIAEGFVRAGYEPADGTADIIARWSGVSVDAFLDSQSIEYLRRTDQLDDLEFILDHVDDVDATVALRNGRLVPVPVASSDTSRLPAL